MEIGRSRAWVHPPSMKRAEKGPDLSHYERRSCLVTVLEVEHTEQFTSVKVLLQRPRNDELDGPIWINVWTNVNHRGHPRGINFCSVTPPHLAPDWESGGQQNLVTKDDGMQCQALAPPLRHYC